MSMSTVGDMRQYLLTARNNTAIKTDMNTLVQELTTGQVADKTKHLGGSQAAFAGLDRQLELLGQYNRSNSDTGQLLSVMQIALSTVGEHRDTASDALLRINHSSSPSQIEQTAAIAQSSFDATVEALNQRSGDRAMFGGPILDTNPLATPAELMADIRGAIAGATSLVDIEASLDTYFNAPTGGFASNGYRGSTDQNLSRSVDEGQSVEIDVRADDQALKDTLKAFAKGAIANDVSLPIDLATRRGLQSRAGVEILGNAGAFTAVQANLGFTEGQVEQASVRNASKETAFGIARNNMIAADPFETATRLQAIQTQLETHYTLTARLSRLSLTEYLR